MRRPANKKTIRSRPKKIARAPAAAAAPATAKTMPRRPVAAKITQKSTRQSIRAPAQRRLVVGITGASGVIYGLRLLECLQNSGIETHLVLTRAAEMPISYETPRSVKDVRALADTVYPISGIGEIGRAHA